MARITVALLATAALCLGPAAAASADDTVVTPTDTTALTQGAGGAGAEGQILPTETAGDGGGTDQIGEEFVEDSSNDAVGLGDADGGGDATETGDGTAAAGSGDTTGTGAIGDVSSADATSADDKGTADTGSDTTTPAGEVGATGTPVGLNIEGQTSGQHPRTGDCQETERSMSDHECNEQPECPADVAEASTFGDNEGGDHCQEPPECPADVAGVSTFGDHEGGDHCQEPPECPADIAQVSTFSDNEGGDHCQEPPECQPAVATYGDHEAPPECPKPPECQVPQGSQTELLSNNEGPNWNEDGKKWECPENPEIHVIPGACINILGDGEGEGGYEVMSDDSVAQVIGSSLKPGHDYKVVVKFDGYEVFSQVLEANGNGMITAWPSLTEVGSYVATITSMGHKPRSASAEFDVPECPPVVVPQLTVTVLPCPGNDPALALQAKLQATGLEPGESYAVSVTGPSGFVWDGSLMGTEAGTAEAIVSLGANGEYTATLAGARAGTDFTATKTCAPKVITPPAAAGPALPNTGSADMQPLLWAGLLTMLVAVGLMLQPARTRRMKR